jgi:hypothetical protein
MHIQRRWHPRQSTLSSDLSSSNARSSLLVPTKNRHVVRSYRLISSDLVWRIQIKKMILRRLCKTGLTSVSLSSNTAVLFWDSHGNCWYCGRFLMQRLYRGYRVNLSVVFRLFTSWMERNICGQRLLRVNHSIFWRGVLSFWILLMVTRM